MVGGKGSSFLDIAWTLEMAKQYVQEDGPDQACKGSHTVAWYKSNTGIMCFRVAWESEEFHPTTGSFFWFSRSDSMPWYAQEVPGKAWRMRAEDPQRKIKVCLSSCPQVLTRDRRKSVANEEMAAKEQLCHPQKLGISQPYLELRCNLRLLPHG